MNYKKYLTEEMNAWLSPLGDSLSDITLISERNLFAAVNGEIKESGIFVSRELLSLTVDKMCRGSIFANQSTLKKGFITLEGGHRVGVCGSAVLSEDGFVSHMRGITALNIRISREIKGCADYVMPYIMEKGRIYNTLIIAPPSRGKTTLLRDAARQCGNSVKCAVADERGEIAGSTGGKITNDVGKYTSVLDGCPKGEGIMMLLRSMAPSVIFTDEIGSGEDEQAILGIMNAGVKIVCTCHGYDEKDILRRPALKSLAEKSVFERIIILSSKGKIGSIEKVIRCYQ